eukprot:CAMPEP_0170488034 /NCGR_PEP_ID=MMETSP0208-20121228/6674_1 /TAXON_ID=197538 /ORGANISM="Strombidium inclinatum, Strain S3" /LENGTH=89 /DNA_ID=CAMNT_0010762467 /DNA_START=865 /DNA_END=1134 /DNA_ORIENTATION=-
MAGGMAFQRERVFAILCSSDHIVLTKKTLPPPTPPSNESVSEEIDENVAYYNSARKVPPTEQLRGEAGELPKIAGLSGVSNIPPSRSIA